MAKFIVPHLYYHNGEEVCAGDNISYIGWNDTMVVKFDKFYGDWNASRWLKKNQNFIEQDGKLYLESDVIRLSRDESSDYNMDLLHREDKYGNILYPGAVVRYKKHKMKLVYRPDKLAYMWHILGTSKFIYHSTLHQKYNKMERIAIADYERIDEFDFKEITAAEFRETGLLWFINTTLHAFGMALVVTRTGDIRICKTKHRGFSDKANTTGYAKVAKYLKENIDEIREEKYIK